MKTATLPSETNLQNIISAQEFSGLTETGYPKTLSLMPNRNESQNQRAQNSLLAMERMKIPYKKILQYAKAMSLALILLFSASVIQAQITSTATGGDWSSTSTWVGGVVPTAAQNVIIATTGANSVVVDVTITQTGSVTVNNGATFNITATGVTVSIGALTINSGGTSTVQRQLTVTGNTSIFGTINFGSTSTTSRLMTFTGSVILNSGAVWNETTTGAAATFSFGSSFTNNATTFTVQNTTHTFSGSGSLSGSTASVIPQVIFTGACTNNGTLTVSTSLTVTGVTIQNNGTITASGALTGSGGLTNNAAGILNINFTGTVGITTLTATAASNTVVYGATGAQTVNGTSYSNLTLSGSGTKTLAAGTAIGQNLTINSGAAAFLSGTANTANALYFGTTQQVSGTWGNTGSGATNINSSYFQGTGRITVATGGPILAITSGSTNHGSSCIGVAAAPIIYTITNTGNTANGVSVTSNNAQFVVSSLSSTTINGSGGTATYVVTFTPNGTGTQTATITVASTTAGSNSPTSSLTGTGNAVPVASVTGQSNVSCFSGSNGSIQITATGVIGPYSFSVDGGGTWTAGGNPYTFSNLSANTPYRIKVKDGNGCISK